MEKSLERLTEKMKIYAYDVSMDDFNFFQDVDDWKKQMTFKGAKNYLVNHLMKSIEHEFYPAITAYIEDSKKTGIGKGFFGLLRIIFPSVTFLGTLYKGNDNSKNAIQFMEDYMGKINLIYKNISDLLYIEYRHGLMHTQMPKVLEIDGKIVCWQITYNDEQHLKFSGNEDTIIIPISPNKFYQDVIGALKKYISDFDDSNLNADLLNYFKQGFIEMSKVYDESELSKKCPTGIKFFRNL